MQARIHPAPSQHLTVCFGVVVIRVQLVWRAGPDGGAMWFVRIWSMRSESGGRGCLEPKARCPASGTLLFQLRTRHCPHTQAENLYSGARPLLQGPVSVGAPLSGSDDWDGVLGMEYGVRLPRSPLLCATDC